jgi:hypothetical protein
MLQYMTGVDAATTSVRNGQALDDVPRSDIGREPPGVLGDQLTDNGEPF